MSIRILLICCCIISNYIYIPKLGPWQIKSVYFYVLAAKRQHIPWTTGFSGPYIHFDFLGFKLTNCFENALESTLSFPQICILIFLLTTNSLEKGKINFKRLLWQFQEMYEFFFEKATSIIDILQFSYSNNHYLFCHATQGDLFIIYFVIYIFSYISLIKFSFILHIFINKPIQTFWKSNNNIY